MEGGARNTFVRDRVGLPMAFTNNIAYVFRRTTPPLVAPPCFVNTIVVVLSSVSSYGPTPPGSVMYTLH